MESKQRRRNQKISEHLGEPTRKRWRPWRPRESSPASNSTESDNSYTDKEFGKPVPIIVENITAKADIIPLFDPESNEMFASQWINKIEQLGVIHNWTSKMQSYFMQSRLSGMAKVWHSSLLNYDKSWEEWKQELLLAFPKNIDFVESLKEMLVKKKAPTESMIQYFYSKNAMLARLEIYGHIAVSCLIDGLPPHMRAPARAGNYNSPSELYSKFLSVME
ncbi:uncharacterized protein ACR2FA_010939 [Aphomia sociella]